MKLMKKRFYAKGDLVLVQYGRKTKTLFWGHKKEEILYSPIVAKVKTIEGKINDHLYLLTLAFDEQIYDDETRAFLKELFQRQPVNYGMILGSLKREWIMKSLLEGL